MNLTGIDSLSFRVASSQEGGGIELRAARPRRVVGTAAVPSTGSTQRWQDVTIDAPDATDTMALYVVFTGNANFRLNFIDAVGQGLSGRRGPGGVTSPTELQALEPGANV